MAVLPIWNHLLVKGGEFYFEHGIASLTILESIQAVQMVDGTSFGSWTRKDALFGIQLENKIWYFDRLIS